MKVSFLKCWNKWILTHTLHSPTNVNESIRRRGRGTLFLLYAWFLSFWFWWGGVYFCFWKFFKKLYQLLFYFRRGTYIFVSILFFYFIHERDLVRWFGDSPRINYTSFCLILMRKTFALKFINTLQCIYL